MSGRDGRGRIVYMNELGRVPYALQGVKARIVVVLATSPPHHPSIHPNPPPIPTLSPDHLHHPQTTTTTQ